MMRATGLEGQAGVTGLWLFVFILYINAQFPHGLGCITVLGPRYFFKPHIKLNKY